MISNPFTFHQQGAYAIQKKSNSRFVNAHESAGNDSSVVSRTTQNNNTQMHAAMKHNHQKASHPYSGDSGDRPDRLDTTTFKRSETMKERKVTGKRSSTLLVVAMTGIAALGHNFAYAIDDQSHYMARWCEATDGSITIANQGHIANSSEVESATVQCPIIRHHNFAVNNWTVLVRDANPTENISCFLRSRSLVSGSTARSATQETPGGGLTAAGAFDYISDFTPWLVFNGGDAVTLQCTLPPAVGSALDDWSWIFLYRVGEDS